MGGSGETTTYFELDRRSNQIAHLFRCLGLNAGDTVAIFLENHRRLLEIAWAAQRSGLYLVCVSARLTASEVDYIVRDSGARLLITSPTVGAALKLPPLMPNIQMMMLDEPAKGYRSFEEACADKPDTPIEDETPGGDMLYSSGTTGRPKGVKLPVPGSSIVDAPPLVDLAKTVFHFNESSIYLCPAPLYHAAPLRWSMAVHRLGGTVVLMEKFEPAQALQLIQKYRVNVSQWVPTHFVRMLKMSPEARLSYDVSSLRTAIHAAAPCPIPVKEAMIGWWGPILVEYYAGTESNGMTVINSTEWLMKRGSVGRAVFGRIRICDGDGQPLSPGTEGLIYFEGGAPFTYHNDPVKTRESRNALGWTTLGDVGRLDDDGYLFVTDRKSFMIISGGVNIYPQEIENVLITHPSVADVAVIGAPDEEMGERVVAVVQPADSIAAGDQLARELEAYARKTLSGVKIPRQFDFVSELPREPTGKLYKRLLRDQYWSKQLAR
jgi:acyl-CoA synthetase (AMP-forming)/AMP-acid ligase II